MNKLTDVFKLIGVAFARFADPGYMLLLAFVTWCGYQLSVHTHWFVYSDKETVVNIAALVTTVLGYVYIMYGGSSGKKKYRISFLICLFFGLLVGIFAAYTKEVLSITMSQVVGELIKSILYVLNSVCGIVIGSLLVFVIGRLFYRRKLSHDDV